MTENAAATKRWSIRRYYTYVDEYHVEAPSLEEAGKRLDDALNSLSMLVDDTPGIVQVVDNEYVDYDSSLGNEIDEHGIWLTDPEEL